MSAQNHVSLFCGNCGHKFPPFEQRADCINCGSGSERAIAVPLARVFVNAGKSDARFDDAAIARARAGELRASGKGQVDAKLLLSALERESALHAQMAVLSSELTKAADLLENIGEQLSGVGNRHMAYACGMRKASASAALAKVTTTNTIPTGELK